MRCRAFLLTMVVLTVAATATSLWAQQPVPPSRPEALPSNELIGEIPAAPQPTDEQPGFTLGEAEFIAQTSNPALREASAKVGVAQGNAVQVGLCPNPMFFTSTPQLAGSDSQYNWVVGQDFITANKLGLNRTVAYREVEKAQLEFTRARYAVLTQVRRAYYTAAAAQRRVELLN